MKLKICGVQSVREARRLADLGVDFISLNFVLTSLRRIDVATAKAIAAALRGSSVQVIVLFQDQPIEEVSHFIQEIQPDYAQLHGSETDAYINALTVPVIKAFTPRQFQKQAFLLPASAAYYLLDRDERGKGPVVDTTIAARIIAAYPERVFLAGGLTPDNLPAMVAAVKPFGIDVAGGVRTGDVLDFAKVEKILDIVRSMP